MHRVSLCLVVPLVLACGLFGPGGPTIRVQGTVTAADDGSPIVGATVRVDVFFGRQARAETDASGRYSLLLEPDGEGCNESEFNILVSTTIWFEPLYLLFGNSGLRCTDEVQTLDFQLKRGPGLVVFADQSLFLNDSDATLTVRYPNPRAFSANPYVENGVTLQHTAGFDNTVQDDTAVLSGNEFGVSGAENIDITFDSPVIAFGMWLEDGAGLDSQFTFTFLRGGVVMGSFTEDPLTPTGQAYFVGVLLPERVDRIEVREVGSDIDEFGPPFNEDDFFGKIYTR